jgi:hypothetical protein
MKDGFDEEFDWGKVADKLTERCGIQEMHPELCQGYGEGDLCDRNCRYNREALDYLLVPAKQRATAFEGYEPPL